MSTANGSNPRTGDTQASEAVQAQQADKQAARAAAKALADAKRHDERFVKAAGSVEQALIKLGSLIDETVECGHWRHVTDHDGTPFATWQAYVCGRVREATTDPDTGESLLGKAMSKAYVVLLKERGVSVRAAAEAVDVSVGTASQAGKQTRTARPGGDTAGVASTPAVKATKACTGAMNANARVRDLVADMSDAERAKLRIDLIETVKVIDGMIALKKQIAAKQAEQAAQAA